ncbi:MAG: YbbR-like domain-containing protein [Oscillospiraceae bacterium]
MPKSNKTRDIFNSKFFWVAFSIIASVLLWVYVTTVEGEEITRTYYGVDVEFSGEVALRDSKGFIITDVSSNSVNVTLKGKRTVLSHIDESSIKAVIDVSTVTRVGSVEKSPTLSFPTNIDSSGITVVSRTPNTISYYVDKETTKTVEVRGTFSGSVADGYIREDFSFDPASVRISGPAAEIDKVEYALVTVERDELDKTVSFDSSFTLMDADGNAVESNTIEYDVDTVNVTLPVKATKDVPLTVDIIDGGGATEEDAVITCDPKSITLAGDPTILDGVNKISVGTIDLSTFDPVFTQKFTIIIPNDVENLTGETEVEVTVEVKGLSTVRRTATNLDYINLPDGYRAEIVSKNLDVVIRGPEDSLSSVAANNIRVVADLTDVTTTGTMAVPVTVYVDGFTDVGAVGEYKIYVTLEHT